MAMELEEIKGALASALPMRPPKFGAERVPPRQKVEALEDYLLASAYARAELEEALHWINALIVHFTTRVQEITGYELALPRKQRERITEADINRAKRTIDSEPFAIGADLKQLHASVLRQINRFEFEEQWVISRAYTLISGS